jgi:hypothetical protein
LIRTIERRLGPEVVATRPSWGSAGWRLADVWAARAVWDDRISSAVRAASRGTVFGVADVRSCYPTISPAAILRSLGPVAGPVVALLERFVDAGVRGLPIGPDPSAILANAVLTGLDDALRRSGVRHLRWVDDIVLWGERADVVRAVAAAHLAASRVGLDLHDRKTRILDDRDELRGPPRSSGRFETSGVRAGGRSAPIIAAP